MLFIMVCQVSNLICLVLYIYVSNINTNKCLSDSLDSFSLIYIILCMH